jgi:outer membrane immunogenic protein
MAILAVDSGYAADAWFPWIDEVRLGATSSATTPFSASVELQALFSPLPPLVKSYDPNWAWLFRPRPLIGASISVEDKTDFGYAGLAWDLPIPRPFFVEFTESGAIHDQTLNEYFTDRPSPLTTRFLFRESVEAGYELNTYWRIMAFWDHYSNGDLGYSNTGINRFGVLLGDRFGARPETVVANTKVSDFKWTGFYFGPSAGLTLGSSNLITPPEPTGATDDKSVNLAGQVGFNWTLGAALLGIEADYAVRHIDSRVEILHQNAAISLDSRWLATARGRVGADLTLPFTPNRMLVYGTGGAAFSRLANSYCSSIASPCYNPSTNYNISGGWATQAQLRTGWTVGGGVELPVGPSVSAKFEYLYVDFGQFGFNNAVVPQEQFKFTEQIMRAGMNFKLY